jgi:hypothetical protein
MAVSDRSLPPGTAELLDRAIARLTASLPSSWTLRSDVEVVLGPERADALLSITAPDGAATTMVVAVKARITSRDVETALRRLDRLLQAYGRPARGMLVARYLDATVRERLEKQGITYADATGNAHVVSDMPGLLIHTTGASRDPWRGPGRPVGSLAGAPAARVVRSLVDHAGPMPMRRLVEVSGASTGAAYRVVELLTAEGLASRDDTGRVLIHSWRRLLTRWSSDYAFVDQVGDGRWLAPRGLSVLEQAMSGTTEFRYAITGSLAAHHWAPYAPTRAAMVYVDRPDAAAARWGLRSVDSGANVLLARPHSDVAYQRSTIADGLILAAPAQVAVDLMSGPGRNPAEAEHLLDWMETHEHAWRR